MTPESSLFASPCLCLKQLWKRRTYPFHFVGPVPIKASQLSRHLPERLSPLSLRLSMDQIPQPLHLQGHSQLITAAHVIFIHFWHQSIYIFNH